MNGFTLFATLLLPLILCTCGRASEPPPPDVSNVSVPLELIRFDRALATLDTTDIASELAALDAEYGAFSELYLRDVMPVRRGDFSPAEQLDNMKALLRYEPFQRLDSIVHAKFDDKTLTGLADELRQALRYYRYYLPDAPVPDTLVTYFSEFSYAGLLYGDNNIAAGLEFFLGPGFDYSQVNTQDAIFSDYLTLSYRPAFFTRKMMQIIIEDQVPRPAGGRLVDQLIYEGKKLYLLDKVLPEAGDDIIHEVTEEQMDWLGANEVAIYVHLQKEDQFFSSSQDLIRKLTQPAPYTQGMPRESPGRAVNYLGLKIVEAYVAANPAVTMEELLGMSDGQKLLAKARYKPK